MGYTARCPGCGMIGPRGRCECGARRGTSGKGGNHPYVSKYERAEFVAIDGEGMTLDDGRHIYTLLAASTGDYIERLEPPGLSTIECLNFLLKLGATHRKSIFVAYAGWYDANMWLGDASKDNLRDLWSHRDDITHYTTVWHVARHKLDLECSFLPKKFYKVRSAYHYPKFVPTKRYKPDGSPEYRRNVINELCIWDVIGFYQCSFIKALEGYGIAIPDEITSGKAGRKDFAADDAATIREYCLLECRLLVELMGRLHKALTDVGLSLRRWDGAGAVAAALLSRERIKEHKGESSAEVFTAARGAMAGGRIECLRYGVIDRPAYGYDINSAYPSVYPRLPSLANGRWVHRTDGTYGAYALCRVRWMLPDDDALYPYHYRDLHGSISFPPWGQGWQWSCVVDVANRHRPGCTEVLESYTFESDSPEYPFTFVQTLYDERKRLKKQGNMANIAIKLALNSLYGKTAQQRGARKGPDGTVTPPPFFQLEWAGYVTAATRAKLYDAAMQCPNDIVYIATDGILSLSPVLVPESDKLGEWEHKQYKSAIVAQSGVYWLENVKWDKDQDHWITHFRGFDSESLQRDDVASALERGADEIAGKHTRFVTLGRALTGDDQYAQWRRWITEKRTLTLVPLATKRELIGRNVGIRRTRAHVPAEASAGWDSALFPIEWLDDVMPAEYLARRLGETEL